MEAEKGNFPRNLASLAPNLQSTSLLASLNLACPLRIITLHSYKLVVIRCNNFTCTLIRNLRY